MFTGIIQTQARVVSANQVNGVMQLTIAVEKQYIQQLNLGASIAINGCCLTVVKVLASDDDLMAQVYFANS